MPKFRTQYARARALQAELIADEMLEIADDASDDLKEDANGKPRVDSEAIQRSKLRIDTRKWLVAKLLPKKYGDQTEDPSTTPGSGQDEVSKYRLTEERRAALIERRRQAILACKNRHSLTMKKRQQRKCEEVHLSPLGFASEVLGLSLYPWQDEVLTWFGEPSAGLVKGTLCTPNGAGKDDRIIAVLALWWVSIHARGRVIITSKDSRQIDEQTYPAMAKHRGQLVGWKFLERYIESPTGGKIILFTTDEPGRAEGWHKESDEEAPLLIIVNEAKSVHDDIFQAFDRCTYNALLYASSPGAMHGTFWQSHARPELGFERLQVGLSECPHISADKIERITTKYGPRHPFTLSALHGEFMLDGAESRFDFEGLERLQRIAEATHDNARRGVISEHEGRFTFRPDPDGWAWISETPREGLAYLAFADPMKGEQSAGSLHRDTHACGILRENYLDPDRVDHPTELVAAIYVEDPDAFSGAACRWELSVLAHRLWLLAGYYGGCTIVPEENNYGGVLIKELLDLDADVWQREDLDHARGGGGRHTLRKYGYQTNSRTKRYWVEALAKAILEQTFVCRFRPAVAQFAAFIQNLDGTCAARPGAFDDFVSGIAIGLTIAAYKTIHPPAPVRETGWGSNIHSRDRKTINRAVS